MARTVQEFIEQKNVLEKAESGRKFERKQEIKGKVKEFGKKALTPSKKKEKRVLRRPKAKLPSVNPVKFIARGVGPKQEVPERTSFFKKEQMEERTKWLG